MGFNDWKVRDKDSGKVWHKDDRDECAEAIDEFGDTMDLEIIPPDSADDSEPQENGQSNAQPNEGDTTPIEADGSGTATAVETETAEEYADQLPDQGPRVDEDPLVWMPEEFTDRIDGTTAINRKGFEVLAHHYDIQCDTDHVVLPSETDYEYAVVKATAVDADGDTYGAYGEADIQERDMKRSKLVRYADTRAYKRAVSRATGVGMVAVEELRAGGKP